MKKTHQQLCALARALDMVGDRWTLLIIRELLPGPRGFRQIRANLPGMASNLMSSRLKDMQKEGLVAEVSEKEGRSGYRLTARGQELKQSVEALIRWGGQLLPRPNIARERADIRWLQVALPALLSGWPKPAFAPIELCLENDVMTIRAGHDGSLICENGHATAAKLSVTLDYPTCLALFGGEKKARLNALAKAKIHCGQKTRSAFRAWIMSRSS